MNGTLEKIKVNRDNLKNIYTKGKGEYHRSVLPAERKSGDNDDCIMLRILVKIIEKESA